MNVTLRTPRLAGFALIATGLVLVLGNSIAWDIGYHRDLSLGATYTIQLALVVAAIFLVGLGVSKLVSRAAEHKVAFVTCIAMAGATFFSSPATKIYSLSTTPAPEERVYAEPMLWASLHFRNDWNSPA